MRQEVYTKFAEALQQHTIARHTQKQLQKQAGVMQLLTGLLSKGGKVGKRYLSLLGGGETKRIGELLSKVRAQTEYNREALFHATNWQTAAGNRLKSLEQAASTHGSDFAKSYENARRATNMAERAGTSAAQHHATGQYMMSRGTQAATQASEATKTILDKVRAMLPGSAAGKLKAQAKGFDAAGDRAMDMYRTSVSRQRSLTDAAAKYRAAGDKSRGLYDETLAQIPGAKKRLAVTDKWVKDFGDLVDSGSARVRNLRAMRAAERGKVMKARVGTGLAGAGLLGAGIYGLSGSGDQNA